MRKGFAIVICGKCHKKLPVYWHGEKYKMPCFYCGTENTIKNTRLKNFKPYDGEDKK